MANPDGLETCMPKAGRRRHPGHHASTPASTSGQDFGAITHFGQSETLAGKAAGEQLNDGGVKNALCVIQEAGNVGLEQRCAGAEVDVHGQAREPPGQQHRPAAVPGDDRAEDPGRTRASTASSPWSRHFALRPSRRSTDAGSKAKVGTFDVNADVVQNIESTARSLFAIDQQPYVQGYLGVDWLYLQALNGNDIGGGQPVYSGPAIITKDNAADVLKFAENGTR